MTKLKVGATNTGNGVFALSNIKKGSVAHHMGGKKLTTGQLLKAIDAHEIRIDDPFQISEERFFKLNQLSYTFNHSCEPNVGVGRRFELVALRDIKAGEQICYDYSTTVCTHCVWRMRCRCGSTSCRKNIGNIRSIPRARREWFMKEHMLPLYIAKEVGRV